MLLNYYSARTRPNIPKEIGLTIWSILQGVDSLWLLKARIYAQQMASMQNELILDVDQHGRSILAKTEETSRCRSKKRSTATCTLFANP